MLSSNLLEIHLDTVYIYIYTVQETSCVPKKPLNLFQPICWDTPNFKHPPLTPLKTTLNPPLSETRPGIIEVLQQGSHCLTTRVGHRQRLAGHQSRKAAQSAPTSRRQVLLPLNPVLLRLTPWPISEEFASAVSWPPATSAAAFDD